MAGIDSEAARLREAAEAKPLRLPVNRKVDESHHALTPDGLSIWYTIQVSPHNRIQEVVFERTDRMPTDEECKPWLDLLIDGAAGIWHLANDGTVTWADLARAAAVRAGLPRRVIGISTRELGLAAPRPLFSALGSRRALLLPPLDDALARYVTARAA